ncbi:MAG: hypothetical protein QFX35_06925 [Candidatus Verstraetearchaeota archaeon]|nr:hypothetical protein [Candidatus Verstraetearchaeota archaeon]
MADVLGILINLVVSIIILSPVLWISGRLLVGKEKAKFTDAIWIVAIGTIIGTVFGYFSLGWIGTIIMIVVWLLLIKHFFDCGWLKAFLVALVTLIIFIVIGIILALILGLAFFAML